MTDKKWIQGAIKREGALRDYFGIKDEGTIPDARLNALITKLQGIENKTPKETRLLRQALLAKRLKEMH